MAMRIASCLAPLLLATGLLAGEPGDGGLGTVGSPPATAGKAGEPLESAVLFVNGRAITRSHVDLRAAAYRRDRPGASAKDLRPMALWSIVFGELLRAEAEAFRRLGMDIPERAVEERWRQMLKDVGGPAELARRQGLSVAALKDLARDDLLADAYRHTMRQQLARPTPAELREYYLANQNLFQRPESAEARAVVIRRFHYDDPDGRAPREGAERRAREVLAQLEAGADFAGLVARYSEEPASASRKGRLGEPAKGFRIERGAYEAPVEKALFGAEPGGPAGLVEGRANYYVLQVLKRSAAGLAPFEAVESEVLDKCREDRVRKAEAKFFRESFAKVLVLDSAGRRLTADDFLAAPAAIRKRSLFDREEEPQGPASGEETTAPVPRQEPPAKSPPPPPANPPERPEPAEPVKPDAPNQRLF